MIAGLGASLATSTFHPERLPETTDRVLEVHDLAIALRFDLREATRVLRVFRGGVRPGELDTYIEEARAGTLADTAGRPWAVRPLPGAAPARPVRDRVAVAGLGRHRGRDRRRRAPADHDQGPAPDRRRWTSSTTRSCRTRPDRGESAALLMSLPAWAKDAVRTVEDGSRPSIAAGFSAGNRDRVIRWSHHRGAGPRPSAEGRGAADDDALVTSSPADLAGGLLDQASAVDRRPTRRQAGRGGHQLALRDRRASGRSVGSRFRAWDVSLTVS